MAQRYFAVVNPGLEDALLAELRSIKVKKPSVQHGGVEFQATRKGLYAVAQRARTPNGLLLRVDEFRAKGPVELYKKTRRVDWERLVAPGAEIRIEATSRRSRVHGTGQIEDTVRDGIRDHFTLDLKTSPPKFVSQGGVRILARLDDDRCNLNLDAAGKPLYIRGWRARTGAAPLRETIASALLEIAGWRPGMPLVDPTCGSGTFVIEAARRALEMTPRVRFDYALSRWENFDQELFDSCAPSAASLPDGSSFVGYDADADVVALARENATGAAVDAHVSFSVGDVRALTRPEGEPGLVIANPPYGGRLPRSSGSNAVEQLLLARFAEGFEGWRLGILTPSDFTLEHPALEGRVAARFRNGGSPVHFHIFEHRGMNSASGEDKLTEHVSDS